jgi:hypothetical protein
MSVRKLPVIVAMSLIIASSASAVATSDAKSPAPPQFTNLKNDDSVSNPVIVQFTWPAATMAHGMDNMTTAMRMGHPHLIVDAPLPAAGQMMPMDSRHIHLMHGETQTTLHLSPGDHSLQLVLAGANHHVGNPPIASVKIIIHVSSATGTAKP